MTRLVRLAPACFLLSCVNDSAPPSQGSKDHICGRSEHYTKQPEDCFKTPTADEAAATAPRAYPDGAPWTAWQGLCLVDGSDRLIAGNGVCELQESLTFRSDCEPTCGDSTLTADEATTCIHDWLADRRGCEAGANICVGPADCGNAKCEYDAQHQEDACNCPEDCSTPDQFRAIRNQDGTCAAPPDDPSPAAVCPCGNGTCEDHETYHSCPEDCDDPGTTTSTTDDSTTGSTTDDTATDTDTDTSPPPCDDDPACGPNETVETCPEQCNQCGDGVIYGDEACDNGTNDDAAYSPEKPPGEPCAPGCVDVAFCGDGTTNAPDETCDESGAQTPTCEANCQLPSCGDGTINAAAGEVCDDSNNVDGDGCTADCKAIERKVFVTSTQFKGDLGGALNNPDNLKASDGSSRRTMVDSMLARSLPTRRPHLQIMVKDPSSGSRISPSSTAALRTVRRWRMNFTLNLNRGSVKWRSPSGCAPTIATASPPSRCGITHNVDGAEQKNRSFKSCGHSGARVRIQASS